MEVHVHLKNTFPGGIGNRRIRFGYNPWFASHPSPGGLLSSQHRRWSTVFRGLFQQTKKKKKGYEFHQVHKKTMVHCGSASARLPYYCTPPVTVPDVLQTGWEKKRGPPFGGTPLKNPNGVEAGGSRRWHPQIWR